MPPAMSYADSLRAQVAHAPTSPSTEEKASLSTKIARNDTIKPELVAAVASMGQHATFHPTKAVEGEKLLDGFVRSCSGFLVDTNIREVKVNQAIVKRDTLHLQKHAILVYFVGGKQQAQVVFQWLNALQSEVGAWLGLGRDLGCGFFSNLH
jgi:hypothetical protein